MKMGNKWRSTRALMEQLRRLGIVEQDDEEEPAPDPDPEGGYAGEPGDDDLDDLDTAMEQDNPFGDDEEDDDEDDMEAEAVAAIGKLSRSFLAKHEAEDEPEDEPDRPSGMGESLTQRLERLAEGRVYRPASPKRAAPSRVHALIEEVSAIYDDIHLAERLESIKGFAQAALIAQTLAESFESWGMRLKEGSLYRVGQEMRRVFEQASDMAVGMDEPGEGEEEPEATEQDDAQVDELFKKLMAKLLDALQLYNDVTGKGDEEPADIPDETDMGGDEEEPEPEPDAPEEMDNPFDGGGDDAEGDDDDDDDEEEEEQRCPECSCPLAAEDVAEARRTLAGIRLRLEAKRRKKKGKKKASRKKRR